MPEGDLAVTLMRRVRRARVDASRTVARSTIIVSARRLVGDRGSMVTRCAWCGRLLLGYGWVRSDEVPQFVGGVLDERTTHGICERCLHSLEQNGESRPLAD